MDFDISYITNKIKCFAYESGFDLVGITSPDIIPEAKKHYKKWIKKGFHGDMTYLGKNVDRRLNIRNIMYDARSVICLAINYYKKENYIIQTPDDMYGKIARYALFKDYHKIIEKRLKLFVKKISEYVKTDKFKAKFYVDYGPVLERAYAAKAGLGFIGKNCNLITKEYGSWVFLTEVIVNIKLRYDTPQENLCGDCTKCLDACPTKALITANNLDARKCISYLTIENKNEIPPNLVNKLGIRLFGCDICQEVCPFNKNPKESFIKDILFDSCYLNLKKILNIENEKEFIQFFQSTALKRAKHPGLMRNANIVLKNIKKMKFIL